MARLSYRSTIKVNIILDALPINTSPNDGSLATEIFNISRVESMIVDAPTTRIHKLSNTEISHQSFVLVRVILKSGAIGYGEGATLGGPRWSEESVESIKSCIDRYLAPSIIGLPANRFEAISLVMGKAASRNNSAKAAIEMAMFDAVGKELNLSAAQLLGGRVHDNFEIIWALASGDTEQEIEEAKTKFELREHRRFKIKIGFNTPKADMARLGKIVDALPDCDLVVDINQAWTPALTKRWLPALEELGIALIEQPLPAADMKNMAHITAQSHIPIMIDEGAFSSCDVAKAGAIHAGNVLSLKLVKSGGLLELRRAAGIAVAHGMELYGGCLLESGLGAAAHLAVFSTLPVLHWGTEHFGPKLLKTDLTNNEIVYKDFQIYCPDGVGLGVTLNEPYIQSIARGSWGS